MLVDRHISGSLSPHVIVPCITCMYTRDNSTNLLPCVVELWVNLLNLHKEEVSISSSAAFLSGPTDILAIFCLGTNLIVRNCFIHLPSKCVDTLLCKLETHKEMAFLSTSSLGVQQNYKLCAISTGLYFFQIVSRVYCLCFLLFAYKVLIFWKFTLKWTWWISYSYCSLKPLWSGMGEVVPARTSPTLHPPSPPTVL